MEPLKEWERAGADIGPATVLAASGGTAVVRLEDGQTCSVALALGDFEARPGDRLLIAQAARGAWAIAVLSALRPAKVEARDGVSAELEDGVLAVRDGEGRLLFEHRPDDGVSVVHAPHGDLRLSAPRGSIALEAGREVRVGANTIDIEGRAVRVGASMRRGTNELTLDRDGATLSTTTLSASAAEARVVFVDAVFAAASVETAMRAVRHVVGVTETRATRVIERAKETFREVEELAQTRAGRIRQIAKGALHMSAERATLKADEDVAIKGDKIHLA